MQSEHILHAALAAAGCLGATLTAPIGGVVSPIHRAVENQCRFAVKADGSRVFIKLRHDDMAPFIKTERVVEASRAAGMLGIAPKLLSADTANGILIFEALSDDWAWGHVDVLRRPDVLENLLAAKRAFHAAEPLVETRSVFDLIASYRDKAASATITLPSSVASVASAVDRISQALAASGVDLVPCHADGVSSNVMVGPGNAVQLVDFEWARQADPAYDLGTVLAELLSFDGEALLAIEMATGTASSQTLARARLFGAADDLMWSLWGFISAATSPRKSVEFFKYAEWRLLRARTVVEGPRFETWLKQV